MKAREEDNQSVEVAKPLQLSIRDRKSTQQIATVKRDQIIQHNLLLSALQYRVPKRCFCIGLRRGASTRGAPLGGHGTGSN
jgi:hypothetical protein